MLRATEQDIDAIGCPQETDFSLTIASHKRNDHDFGFLTLKVVNCRNAKQVAHFLSLDCLRSKLLLYFLLCKTISQELFFVPFRHNNLKVPIHSSAELLELTDVWCQNGDVLATICTLPYNVPHKSMGHLDLIFVRFRMAHWFSRMILKNIMIKP